jgi:hypothetical protein
MILAVADARARASAPASECWHRTAEALVTARLMHWKPTWLRRDGAACGRLRVQFTGERARVTCKRCLRAKAKQ